jgi:putative ABC transport system ATP-binding protein
MDAMVRVEWLDFAHAHGEFRLKIPRLVVARGEAVAVVGATGAGKTTLLHLLAGILRPASGRAVVDGKDLARMVERARRVYRSTRVGLVFEDFELLGYLNLEENILLPFRVSGALTLDSMARQRARSLAKEAGIRPEDLVRLPHQVCQGSRQRAAVCRALVTLPALILADEPTAHLDPASQARVLELLLKQARRTSATLVVVTHDRGILHHFDRVLHLEDLSREEARVVQLHGGDEEDLP